MPASCFNSVHASVDPRGVLIRDFLAEAGEEHGRNIADAVLSRFSLAPPGAVEAATEIIEAELRRMVSTYVAAGCSRRQVRAFCSGFARGSAARVRDGAALATVDHQGSA